MRAINLHIAAIVALVAICFTCCATGYQPKDVHSSASSPRFCHTDRSMVSHAFIGFPRSSAPCTYRRSFSTVPGCSMIALPNGQLQNDERHLGTLLREKRQMENFDDTEEFSAPQQETPDDPSFWDRVVRVAIKLFSKFVEWLNS